jgi:thiamine pyrophosphate-dependent acetolactate synthase large subunit-like protein
MARGMGITAERVEDPSALQRAVRNAVAKQGPHLIEVVVSGKQ